MFDTYASKKATKHWGHPKAKTKADMDQRYDTWLEHKLERWNRRAGEEEE